MTDLRATIIPKSDQMNSDDLIGGPVTIKVVDVSLLKEAEQPIAINYEGDGGKPYKPCKSMRRVMVTAWGPDGNAYKGRSMTLYRDPSVLWGGQQVGGIRISHLSDIKEPMTMALTATKQSRKPFTVRPMGMEKTARPAASATSPANTPPERPAAMLKWIDGVLGRFAKCTDAIAMFALIDEIKADRDILREDAPEQEQRIVLAVKEANARLAPKQPADDPDRPAEMQA